MSVSALSSCRFSNAISKAVSVAVGAGIVPLAFQRLWIERLYHNAPDHVGVSAILDGPCLIDIRQREPPAPAFILGDTVHEFRPLLDDAQGNTQSLVDPAFLLLRQSIGS